MMNEGKNSQTQEQEEFLSVNVPDNHQSENASEKCGLVSVVYHASWCEFDKETYEEKDFEEDEHEWYEADAELPARIEYLRENAEGCGYTLSDCRLSLAEYTEPELTEQNISRIKTFFLLIRENENFYYSIAEDAREALLEHCRQYGIPTPNEIQYTPKGYYIKWNLERGYSGSEVPLWRFIQKTLHDYFAKLGSDLAVCLDATAMLYVSGFRNSDYVGFDLSERVITIYNNDEVYSSPLDFVRRLPLWIDDIKSYRKEREKCKKSASKIRRSGKTTPIQTTQPALDEQERSKLWFDSLTRALRDENCKGEEYRLWQEKATENPKRRKYYKWLRINPKTGVLPKFYSDRDSWLSAATYYSMWKGKGYVASINCNFLIIKWEKSELGYTPTPEEGKELVLSRCRELGLPEPYITSTPDGLEVKWYWRDRMQKVFYDNDPYCSKFNEDWERIQRELYKKFWYLGVDLRKGATAMFSMPGSMNTTKKLKTADRLIRDIHSGVTVSSYREIQRILGLKETNSLEVPDELLGLKWEVFSTYHRELAEDWLADILRMHPSSKNWVCVSMIKDGWKNHWEQACNLPKYLMSLVKNPDFDLRDIYVSQGEFFSRGNRHVNNLVAIQVCFVDLDYKYTKKYHPELTKNPTPEEWEELIKAHCAKFKIPLPNVLVFSGGGVHLKWIFDEGVSRSDLEYWQYAQRLLLVQFETLGADPASVDAARVLRLVGTKNQKDNPEITNRNVHVVDREYFSQMRITLRGLIDGLENSQPENAEEFNACVSEWQETLKKLEKAEAEIIRPETEEATSFETEDFRIADGEYWRLNTLHHHRPRATWLGAEVSGTAKWLETYQLHGTLRELYGTPELLLSLSELTGRERKESRGYIEWIPCNYVVLSHCPGETFEEQKANIFRHCEEYRGVGIYEPNQIIQIGSKLLVEWTYSSVLPGKALSRWHRVQEFLSRHFEDWGAMENPEYQKATALLPVPGFVYGDGETARLVYSELEKRYTFNGLANAVLNWSQKECKKYQEEKEARKAILKIALIENIEQLKQAVNTIAVEATPKYGDFRVIAQMRFVDILHWLELQKDSNGDVPQKVRELSVFWALVSARQAGLIRTWEEFCIKAQKLIDFCGAQFASECTIETVKSAFTKNYYVKNATLIRKLQITPEAQKEMKVLVNGGRVTTRKRSKQTREEYLATHDQERSQPWLAYGFSRRTYFRRKKAGTLPPLPVQVGVNAPVSQEKIGGTSLPYIMTRARAALLLLLWQAVLLRLSEQKSKGYQGASGGIQEQIIPLLLPKFRKWVRIRSLLYFKRRRKSKRKRKRKRG